MKVIKETKIKRNLQNDKVLYLYLPKTAKEQLTNKAQEMGMTLTTYCRMILIESLKPC